MKIGGVILARMSSSRLPGKALRPVGGRVLLDYVVDAAQRVKGLDQVILATSGDASDAPLVAFAQQRGIACFRGSLNHVAGRFLGAMEHHELDAALRINGDSPMHSPALMAQGVETFRRGEWDLVTNVHPRSFPYGMTLEVAGRRAMTDACEKMTGPDHREHVTAWFYQHPEMFRIKNLVAEDPGVGEVELTVDEPRDLERFAWIEERLGERLHEAAIPELAALAAAFEAAHPAEANA